MEQSTTPSTQEDGAASRGQAWSVKSWSESLISQIKTTYRSSKDEIGWLQREEGLPPVVDRSERFLHILAAICHGIHMLPENLACILVPGTTHWLPRGMQTGPYHSLYFVATEKHLQKLGLTCQVARLDDDQPLEASAGELTERILEMHASTGKRIAILAHGTGGVVATSALALSQRQLEPCVAGIVVMQCPYAGSPIVTDALRSAGTGAGQLSSVLQLALAKIFKGSFQSLQSLTYASRRQFLCDHPFPTTIPVLSFHTEAPKTTSLLSRVHHAEVSVKDLPSSAAPLLPAETAIPPHQDEKMVASISASRDPLKRVGVSFPVPATLTSIAWQLELWYGAKNDGFVMRADAEVPGSVVVRPCKKLDHSWLAFGGSKTGKAEMPEPPHVAEALLSLLLESIEDS